jgi:hypothetical protein
MTDPAPDGYDLPPTQALVLEVLAARWRLGEKCWTFAAAHRPALRTLAERGLITWKDGSIERTCLAWLTVEGRKAALSDTYKGPRTFTRESLTNALTRLELRVQLTGPIAGKINAEAMADAIIEALEQGER